MFQEKLEVTLTFIGETSATSFSVCCCPNEKMDARQSGISTIVFIIGLIKVVLRCNASGFEGRNNSGVQ
jgi:hypothetical protein